MHVLSQFRSTEMSHKSCLAKWDFDKGGEENLCLGGGGYFVCNYYVFPPLLCESELPLTPVSFSMLLQIVSCMKSISLRIFHKFINSMTNQSRELSRTNTWKNTTSNYFFFRRVCAHREACMYVKMCHKRIWEYVQEALIPWINVSWLFCLIAAVGGRSAF